MGVKYLLFFPILVFLSAGCTNQPSEQLTSEYLDSLKVWKMERYEEVTKSWLPLAGLKWLEGGVNTFGSDTSNSVIFPPSAPSHLGQFYLSGDTVSMITFESIDIKLIDSLAIAREMVIDESKIFSTGRIEWTVIKRAGKHAVRIWDRTSTSIDSFKLEYFEPDPKWLINCEYIPYPEGRTYLIANVMGSLTDTPIPGKLQFEISGKEYSLDVMEGGKDSWYVIFSDQTNGEQTYGAGRYLYVKKAQKNEETVIDFNRSYNPPCAFTEYATCPLPPPQNRLALAIPAGEKSSDSEH